MKMSFKKGLCPIVYEERKNFYHRPILPTILRIWKTWLLPKAKKFDYHMLLYFLKKIYCCPPFKKKRWSVKGKKLVVADLPQIFKFPSHFLPVSTWVKPRTKDRPVQLSEFTIQNTLVETKYFWSSLINLHIFFNRFLLIFTILGQREM